MTLLVAWPKPAGATDVGIKYCDPRHPDRCTQAVRKGAPAPFTGVLSTPAKAAEVTVQLERKDEEIARAVTATVAIWRLKYGEQRALRQVDARQAKAREEALREEIPKWYEEPQWVVIWTLAGLALVAGSLELVKGLGK